MGKTMNMIGILVFVDILFLIFWGGSSSLQSIVMSALIDNTNYNGSLLAIALTQTLLVSLIGFAVVAIIGSTKTDTILFATFGLGTLFNLGKDFIFMFQEIKSINLIVATLFLIPITVMYMWIIVEWIRGKD